MQNAHWAASKPVTTTNTARTRGVRQGFSVINRRIVPITHRRSDSPKSGYGPAPRAQPTCDLGERLGRLKAERVINQAIGPRETTRGVEPILGVLTAGQLGHSSRGLPIDLIQSASRFDSRPWAIASRRSSVSSPFACRCSSTASMIRNRSINVRCGSLRQTVVELQSRAHTAPAVGQN